MSACTTTSAPPTPPPTTKPAPARTATTGKAPAESFELRTQKLDLSRGAGRPLPTTVWMPAATGRYPMILFSHGLSTTPRSYATLLTAWARAGFVVAAPAYPHTAAGVADFNPVDVLNQPTDARSVITQVGQRLADRIDPARIAAAGHSAGGVTTLGLFAGPRDDRLRAGVVLAGRQIVSAALQGAAAPLLFVHGKRDATVAYADGHAVYDAVTWPKAFLTVTEGGHVSSGDELDVITTTTTDFWRWSLYRDPAAKARLPKDATRGGLATLADRL